MKTCGPPPHKENVGAGGSCAHVVNTSACEKHCLLRSRPSLLVASLIPSAKGNLVFNDFQKFQDGKASALSQPGRL